MAPSFAGEMPRKSANSEVMRAAARGSRKLSVPTATSVAPARSNASASRPLWTPPIPTTGIVTRSATSATWASAIGRTAGPDTPPVPPPSHGSPLSGASAIPLRVLISETASAPASCAARATAPGSVALGVSLTISGLPVSGRTRSRRAAVSEGSAPMTSPLSTLGHDTLSSSATTSSRSAKAATSVATSSRVKPMTLTISGTGRRASTGRSCFR